MRGELFLQGIRWSTCGRLVTAGGRRAKTSGGERLSGLDGTNLGLDLIVVPGFFLGDPRYVATQMRAIGPEAALLIKLIAGGTKVASICVGAFVLGAAGLLDGRRATTGWLFAGRGPSVVDRIEGSC
jgi:transcriptional regulator GlxA family with amidase domain